MSWLQLTSDYLFLMQGGTNAYIDRSRVENHVITKFPREWFTSVLQRPRTLITALDANGNDVTSFTSERNIQLLRKMEVPISYRFYNEMRKVNAITGLLDLFKTKMGDFTSEFYSFHDTLSNKYLNVEPLIFSVSDQVGKIDALIYPDIDFNPRDPDYTKATPSFWSIFIEVLKLAKVSLRPRVSEYQPSNSKISLKIDLIMQPNATLISGPTPLWTLENALRPAKFNYSGNILLTLDDVFATIKKERSIIVNAPGLRDETDLPDLDGLLTFTDVMDTLASHFSAYWDWVGDRVILTKRSSL